jgi:hypothetical protein
VRSRAVVFSCESVPSKADPNWFDVFDGTFREPSVGGDDSGMGNEAPKPESAVSDDSEPYSMFLRSDGHSGEIAAMRNDWLRRMRLEIVDQDSKYRKCCQAIKAHEASGGDPKDVTYARNKFIAAEKDLELKSFAIDSEEGNVSESEKLHGSSSHTLAESYEDFRVSLQRDREVPCTAAAQGFRHVYCCGACSVRLSMLPIA